MDRDGLTRHLMNAYLLSEGRKEGRKEGTQTSRDPEGRRLPATATLLGPRGPSSSDSPGLQAAQ